MNSIISNYLQTDKEEMDTLMQLMEEMNFVFTDNDIPVIAQELIEENLKTVPMSDEDGDGILHLAVLANNIDVVKMLLASPKKQTFINSINHNGQTPLHLAVLTNQIEMVECLMSNNADVSIRDSKGNTAIHMICACRTSIWADKKVILDCLLRFVKKDVINSYNFEGETAMMSALYSGETQMKELIDTMIHIGGADINKKKLRDGKNIIHILSSTGNTDLVIDICENHDVDLTLEDYSGLIPLEVASSESMKTVLIKYLNIQRFF